MRTFFYSLKHVADPHAFYIWYTLSEYTEKDEAKLSILDEQSAVGREQALRHILTGFSEIGAIHDHQQTVPIENIAALKKSGYTALPVETKYGGRQISLSEMLYLQQLIAEEDGPTALCIGWHMGTMYQLVEEKNWPKHWHEQISCDVVEKGVLLNTAATEKATGSPTRGGAFQTTAKYERGEWVLNGTKTFTTLAEHLDYYLILATVEPEKQVGLFIVPQNTPGVTVEKTWDMMAMGSTGSEDLHLKNVKLPSDHFIKKQEKDGLPTAWLLHIPACYLGIACAAIREAAKFANSYSPNSIQGTIAQLPHVKQKLGEAVILYEQSRHFLYSVANKWDNSDKETRMQLNTELKMVKYAVVNNANRIVDTVMRAVGAHSLSNQSPLSRYYKNVRAGLHNPPMDDMVVHAAAESVLQRES